MPVRIHYRSHLVFVNLNQNTFFKNVILEYFLSEMIMNVYIYLPRAWCRLFFPQLVHGEGVVRKGESELVVEI